MAVSNEQISKMNLYQKLAMIRKSISVLRKSKSGFGYKYTPEDEILIKVVPAMEKYHISLIPMINPGGAVTPIKYVDKKGKDVTDVIVNADMVYRWVNDDDPGEFIDVPWMMVGQQSDAAQAMGAGLTYTNRYFLLKYFQIATVDDDPDNYKAKQQQAIADENAKALEAAKTEALDLCKSMKDAGIPLDTIYNAVEKYTGNRNPNSIKHVKDIETVQKFIDDIKKLEVTPNA